MDDNFTNPPSFGGKAGEPVPIVDADDLKTLWREQQELQTRYPGAQVAIGMLAAQHMCKPEADVQAVGYRLSMVWVLNHVAPEQLAPWTRDGQVTDAVFRTIAKIPMEWTGGTERQGLPFDVDEFFRRLNQDQPGGTPQWLT